MKVITRLTLLCLALIVAGVIFFVLYNKSPGQADVVISYKNTSSVNVYDISESQDGVDKELVSSISLSGEPLSLSTDRQYLLTYKGNTGFESGEINFDVSGGDKDIEIDPYYSSDKLSTLLNVEVQNIQKSLQAKYPKIGLYQIQPGKLYHFGDWYGTKLRYVGTDSFNSDDLRVVLHKKNNRWVVITDPPNITLSKFIYADVPEDILRDVNNFL